MAPVIKALENEAGIESLICVTAQHRDMLDQVLELFNIKPDYDLDIMTPNQNLIDLTTVCLKRLNEVLSDCIPDRVLVHGDTTTSFVAALACYYSKIPVAHIEAGLRTNNIYSPWPEEMNRRLTDTICDLHFAPTQKAKNNLLQNGIPETSIHITGNTVIDALLDISNRIEKKKDLVQSINTEILTLINEKKTILVTGHRRENFGNAFEEICRALVIIADRTDVQIIYPVHLNPNVQEPVTRILSGHTNIHLVQPQNYLNFVYLMIHSFFIITDSGGIQEEAPALGKPVLVLRDVTERTEGLDAGTIKLVGADKNNITDEAFKLLDDKLTYKTMSNAHNPYGDGQASSRIMEKLISEH
ncbi:MAG: UDP-N-acetylglucosamine 2-epimerase (non-hydrolyzing) [Rhodospirillaceae bacterium]|nr:UDP-N-acetylglucosamine 2-epimerase (non-hydrolyzing) [Rhodospirillaceae bacterium]OUT80667.1 MAG: UDP-N-acetylglucosamine 2-epimerase (non-hydrolyzing) [Rhodospirillaceae bacterium TMED23]